MISTKGKYAIIIMPYLANNYKNNSYISLKEIAQKEKLSVKYLEKIISMLNKKKYLISLKGKKGGYKLSNLPSTYKINDILEAVGENLKVIPCNLNGKICFNKNNCKMYSFWNGLDEVIKKYIDNKTLENYIGE